MHMTFSKALPTVFAAGVLAGGCSKSDTVRIADVTKSETVNLVTRRFPNPLAKGPSGISVHIYGKIDGTASIYNAQWGTNKIAGTVNWSRNNDWFHTNCQFTYIPEQVRSGQLTIQCTFW